MLKKALLFSALISISGCAYYMEDSIQDVKFVTPGANGAMCNVYVDGIRHRVYPPETINIRNTDEDLIVDCLAPGNRRQEIYVRPTTAKSADANFFNFGLGYAWDHASGALYKYPSVIEVNFTDTPVKPNEMPAQNSPDIRQPESYPLEEFKPSKPKLNNDAYETPPEIRRRGESDGFYSAGEAKDEGAFYEPSGPASGKGNLKTIPGE